MKHHPAKRGQKEKRLCVCVPRSQRCSVSVSARAGVHRTGTPTAPPSSPFSPTDVRIPCNEEILFGAQQLLRHRGSGWSRRDGRGKTQEEEDRQEMWVVSESALSLSAGGGMCCTNRACTHISTPIDSRAAAAATGRAQTENPLSRANLAGVVV